LGLLAIRSRATGNFDILYREWISELVWTSNSSGESRSRSVLLCGVTKQAWKMQFGLLPHAPG